MIKKCKICGAEKPAGDYPYAFGRIRKNGDRGKGHYKNQCRECLRERHRLYETNKRRAAGAMPAEEIAAEKKKQAEAIIGNGHMTCKACGKTKLLSEFPKDKAYVLGYRKYCKPCFQKKYYKQKEHPVHFKCCDVCGDLCTELQRFTSPSKCARHQWRVKVQTAPQWWIERYNAAKREAAKTKEKARRKKYEEKNGVSLQQIEREKYKERYRTDPEFRKKEKKRKQLDRLANPDKYAKQRNARKARLAMLSNGSVTRIEIMSLFRKYKSCPYCGCDITSIVPHVDHIIPISKGGEHKINNLVLCCPACNIKKGAKDIEYWVERLRPRYKSKVLRIIKSNKQYQMHLI